MLDAPRARRSASIRRCCRATAAAPRSRGRSSSARERGRRHGVPARLGRRHRARRGAAGRRGDRAERHRGIALSPARSAPLGVEALVEAVEQVARGTRRVPSRRTRAAASSPGSRRRRRGGASTRPQRRRGSIGSSAAATRSPARPARGGASPPCGSSTRASSPASPARPRARSWSRGRRAAHGRGRGGRLAFARVRVADGPRRRPSRRASRSVIGSREPPPTRVARPRENPRFSRPCP